MAEWTAETRHELYALLAEGKIVEAFDLVGQHVDLRANQFTPLDKKSMASMAEHVHADPEAQALIADRIIDNNTSLQRLAAHCLKSISNFPPEPLLPSFDAVTLWRAHPDKFVIGREGGMPKNYTPRFDAVAQALAETAVSEFFSIIERAYSFKRLNKRRSRWSVDESWELFSAGHSTWTRKVAKAFRKNRTDEEALAILAREAAGRRKSQQATCLRHLAHIIIGEDPMDFLNAAQAGEDWQRFVPAPTEDEPETLTEPDDEEGVVTEQIEKLRRLDELIIEQVGLLKSGEQYPTRFFEIGGTVGDLDEMDLVSDPVRRALDALKADKKEGVWLTRALAAYKRLSATVDPGRDIPVLLDAIAPVYDEGGVVAKTLQELGGVDASLWSYFSGPVTLGRKEIQPTREPKAGTPLTVDELWAKAREIASARLRPSEEWPEQLQGEGNWPGWINFKETYKRYLKIMPWLADSPWYDASSQLRAIVSQTASFDLVESWGDDLLAEWNDQFAAIVDHVCEAANQPLRGLKGEDMEYYVSWVVGRMVASYCLFAREADERVDESINRLLALQRASEPVERVVEYTIYQCLDVMHDAPALKPWWGDLARRLCLRKGSDLHRDDFAVLAGFWQVGNPDPLMAVFEALMSDKRSRARLANRHDDVLALFVQLKGRDSIPVLLEKAPFSYRRALYREALAENPQALSEFLATETGVNGYAKSMIDEPAISEGVAAMLVRALDAEGHRATPDLAFDLIIEKPSRIEPAGMSVLDLLREGLWSEKSKDVKKRIGQILQAEDANACSPEEVFEAIEEVLGAESPTIINAAVSALKKLRKKHKDRDLPLANPERARDLIEADAQRWEKKLTPLL